MLKSFSIDKLFGQYSYSCDFSKDTVVPNLLYLTGPNGMGKTTILKMIYDLYHFRLERFVFIPFSKAVFTFENGDFMSFSQTTELPKVEQESDVPAEGIVTLVCDYNNRGSNISEEHTFVLDNGVLHGNEVVMPRLEQFLESDACFFITDARLNSSAKDVYGDASINPEKIASVLLKMQNDFKSNFNSNSPLVMVTLQDNQYRIKKIVEKLAFLRSCRLIIPDVEEQLANKRGEELLYTILCAEKALSAIEKDFQLVYEFKKMIDEAAFVDKKIILSPFFGFRVQLSNGRFIEFGQLSSGEQHFFCQAYTMFFVVKEKSFVMIDEPEISFHMMWQMVYAKQMKRLVKVRKLRLLIATHSPEMFGCDFSMTVDLYRQNRPKDYNAKSK